MELDIRYLKEPVIEKSGTLGILDSPELPFQPQRLYWIHSVPPGSTRGNHAHKKLHQFFWVIRGTVEIELSNGLVRKSLLMHENKELLVVSPGYWRKLFNFSEDAILMVGANATYNPHDYIHDWEEFLNWKKTNHEN
jgi:dTDP-4-dehydrorhamnose 3,5-epimerase-like enzyme